MLLLLLLLLLLLQDVAVREFDDELYIVMELLDSDLHRIIQSAQALSDAHHRYFMYQLLRGVKFLHDNRIIHRYDEIEFWLLRILSDT
jgi:serine/threonine protein kinase